MTLVGTKYSAAAIACLSMVIAEPIYAAVSVRPSYSVDDAGVLTVAGDITARVNLFNEKWAPTRQSKDNIKAVSGYPKDQGDKWELAGELQATGIASPFAMSENVSITVSNVKYQCSLTAGENVEVNTIALVLQFPVARFKGQKISFDGQELVLPVQFSGSQDVFQGEGIDTITLSIPDGKKLKMVGPIDVYLQDDRRFRGTAYTLRLFFKPKNGSLKKGETSNVAVTFEQSTN